MTGGTALVTGITGQDELHGALRGGAEPDGFGSEIATHETDSSDRESVAALIDAVDADMVFHLGGVSSVAASWDDPVHVVNAASREIFAGAPDSSQTEATPIRPISPYGASKAFGHNLCQVYRWKSRKTFDEIVIAMVESDLLRERDA